MSAVDQAWQRMKEVARTIAAGGRRISLFQAEAIVTRLLQECGASPMPRPDTIEFFARELLAMVENYQPVDETSTP